MASDGQIEAAAKYLAVGVVSGSRGHSPDEPRPGDGQPRWKNWEACARGTLEAAEAAPVLRVAHKVMTPAEYAAVPIAGWHEVCRDVDGFGGVGIRYLGEPAKSV